MLVKATFQLKGINETYTVRDHPIRQNISLPFQEFDSIVRGGTGFVVVALQIVLESYGLGGPTFSTGPALPPQVEA
jgi:hypothetical protein